MTNLSAQAQIAFDRIKLAAYGTQAQPNLTPNANWQTKQRGTNDAESQISLSCANAGKGGDITRNGKPLKTYDEWLNS